MKLNISNILTIARLSREKNLLVQIKAIKMLQKNNIFLNILGDGKLKNQYNRSNRKFVFLRK